MRIEDCIDGRSKLLFEQIVAAGIEIDLIVDPSTPTWSIKEFNRYRITAPDNTPNPAAVAHELLHITLSLAGFAGVVRISLQFNQTNSIFNPEFIGILNNDLAHYKMVATFHSMGFSLDEFL